MTVTWTDSDEYEGSAEEALDVALGEMYRELVTLAEGHGCWDHYRACKANRPARRAALAKAAPYWAAANPPMDIRRQNAAELKACGCATDEIAELFGMCREAIRVGLLASAVAADAGDNGQHD